MVFRKVLHICFIERNIKLYCSNESNFFFVDNSDLIACVVIPRDGQRSRRFLVIDVIQLILVEPDTRRLGWGVAKFVGFLQVSHKI